MSKITIVELITHLPPGGAQRVALSLAEGLDKDLFDVHLATGPGGAWNKKAKEIKGLTFHLVKNLKREISPKTDSKLLFELVALLYRIKKKSSGKVIVHTHAPKAGLMGRLAAKITGCEILHTLHGFPFNEFQTPAKRFLYKKFESIGYFFGGKVVSVTEINRLELGKLGFVDPEKVAVIPPSADLGSIVTKTTEHAENTTKNEKVIGFIASLKPPKDPLCFVKAAHEICRQKTNVKFIIAGGGELEDEVKNEIEKRHLTRQIEMTGWFDPIEELYPKLDILALPTFSEGLPLSLVEAMYAGVNVVASEVGGISEIIDHEKTGLLVPAGNSSALAKAMLKLLDDEKFAEKLRNEAKLNLNRYTIESTVKQYEKLFLQI